MDEAMAAMAAVKAVMAAVEAVMTVMAVMAAMVAALYMLLMPVRAASGGDGFTRRRPPSANFYEVTVSIYSISTLGENIVAASGDGTSRTIPDTSYTVLTVPIS